MSSSQKQKTRLIDYLANVQPDAAGYLHFRYNGGANNLFLGFGNGRIIWSGKTPFSIESLLEIVNRYLIHAQNPMIASVINRVRDSSQNIKPLTKICQLVDAHVLDEALLSRAIRSQLFSDMDRCLYEIGTETFSPESYLSAYLPIKGFSIRSVVEMSLSRRKVWSEINQSFTVTDVFFSKQEFIPTRYLPMGQRDLFADLIGAKLSVREIAARVCMDEIEVAKIFLELLRNDIISLPEKVKSKQSPGIPPIMAIDSSDSVLKRIYHTIDKLGYPMIRCNNIDLAIDILKQKKPILVLIETKMLSFGESQLKQVIQDNPSLTDVPIAVMSSQGQRLSRMTAEKYAEIQRPEDSGEVSAVRLQQQISGILEQGNSSNN